MIRQKYFCRTLLIASIMALTFAFFLITDIDIKASDQEANGSMPLVQAPHGQHEISGVKCIICHHKTGNDERIKQCTTCHLGQNGMTVMHNFCIKCHTQRKKGPVACQDCHKVATNK
jgi:hypothetical protein